MRASIYLAALILVPTAMLASSATAEAQRTGSITAANVVAAFSAAGLPVQSGRVFTSATDPNHLLGRPGQYTSKVNFYDARHPYQGGEDDTGENTVEVFATPAAAKARRDYIQRVTQGTPYLQQYLVLNGRVLARFHLVMLPAEVDEYRAALAKFLAGQKAAPVPTGKGTPRARQGSR